MFRDIIKISFCVLIFIFVFVLCVLYGSTGSVLDLSNMSIDFSILNLRLPRIVLICLVGAILSICGLAMQTILNNPLADGSTVGVSSGASLGAVIFIVASSGLSVFGLDLTSISAGAGAIIFSFLSLGLILFASYKIDASLSSNSIILIGIIFSMFASALVNLIIALNPECAQTFTFWTMGSVVAANYQQCIVLLIVVILGFVTLFCFSDQLDICSLGEAKAKNLGVNVKFCRLFVLIIVSLMIGISVSFCGTIAFVGLAVPHICRFIVGVGTKKLLFACCLFGSTFLMMCDLFSRVVISPKELPIGVITSIIGAIVFIVVYFNNRKVKG